MMYNNKLAVTVKANGKVLREFKDTVYVPFGTEYSILVKNLNTVRAQVRIYIDGTDVTDGTDLVINANSELELTRFIKNGNLKEGNRFKFIERTASIEKHKGIGIEDGLVRVEYQFEDATHMQWLTDYLKRSYERQEEEKRKWYKPYDTCYGMTASWSGSDTKLRSFSGTPLTANYSSIAVGQNVVGSTCDSYTVTASGAVSSGDGVLMNMATASAQPVLNDAGITVAGSKSTQQFREVSSFPLEATKHSIVLKLLGETETGKPVVKPVTVKAKPKCTTCGHQNKVKAKFCSECGTALEIL